MTLLRTVLIASASLWLCAAAVSAQDAESKEPKESKEPQEQNEFTRTGWYTGLSVMMGVENFQGSSAHDVTGGFDLRVGYRATPIFSFELDTSFLAKFPYEPGQRDITSNLLFGQPPNLLSSHQEGFETEVSIWQLTGNLKASGDLSRFGDGHLMQRFQPFGLLGIGVYNAKYDRLDVYGGPYDNTDAVAKLGAGVDYYLSKRWVIALEGDYNFVFNGSRRLDYFGLALGAYMRF
jgi:opacity protein-like surface antigen